MNSSVPCVVVVPGDPVSEAGQYTTMIMLEGGGSAMVATVVGQVNDSGIVVPLANMYRSAIPRPGVSVYCRVVRVTPRFAGVDIIGLAFEDPNNAIGIAMAKLPIAHKGTIRQQDIYAVEERETAVVYDCFRPMDLVRARVIGTGDTSSGLLLSTGLSLDLGVVEARSASSGGRLAPVAWNEMICIKTGAREKRKVAKP